MTMTGSILVIDDELNLRRSLALILQRSGYNVTTAGCAREVLQYLEAGAFDLVFLDLKMPDVNGLDLLHQIHRLYPDMPILILTAHATLESAIEAVRRGARDYLLKPIDPVQIVSRVQDVVAEAGSARRRRKIVEEMEQLLREWHRIEQAGQQPQSSAVSTWVAEPTRTLRRGPFSLDLYAQSVTLEGRAIQLSPTAFDYLTTLVRHSPDAVACEQLVLEAQGFKANAIEARQIARWRIHELRKALEPEGRNPLYIITVRGMGYRLVT